jgi:hypothetical protein
VTRLSNRKTRLTFETEAQVKYRGKYRPVVVEPDMRGDVVSLRLKGTRVRYEVSWQGTFEHAAKVHAERLRAEKKQRRAA